MNNLLLADDYSVVDDRISPPATHQPEDLGHLLDKVAERLLPGGVLMLSGRWGKFVAPIAEHQGGEQGTPNTVRAGDWSARVVRDDTWIMWAHPDKHKIWTCEIDALEPGGKDTPLIAEQPHITALNFADWTRTTGVPWVGTPGMTGNGLLVDGWRDLSPKADVPRWHSSAGRWDYGHIEQPYIARQWSREIPGGDGSLHGYDLNKAYLSAYVVAELPADSLERKTNQEFDRKRGGIWRVALEPWRYEQYLPDPAGYGPVLDDGTRWLTTPTLTLLEELERRGDHGGFTVIESHTAPSRRITRKWAELLNDVAGAARDPLNRAAKQVYKQTYGMWARPTRVYRPDWHYTMIAQARTNLWRKIDTGARYDWNGHTHKTFAGAVQDGTPEGPVRIETDALFYPAGDLAWDVLGSALGFRLDPTGQKLGHFKPVEDKAP